MTGSPTSTASAQKQTVPAQTSTWRSLLPWLAWAALLVIADLCLKQLVMAHYLHGESTPVTSFFSIVRVHNTGAAFSFLASHSGWQRWFFVGIALAASIFIIWLLWRHTAQNLFSFALACIMGGAIGNVVDRLLYGYVVDYLDFYWAQWHFPAFNLADCAITSGAALLILDELLRMRRQKKAPA